MNKETPSCAKGGARPWEKWKDHDSSQWGKWKDPNAAPWKQNQPGCGLFLRFLFVFGLVVLLVLGGMAVLALLFTRAAGGSDALAPFVWLASCGLALALPILAVTIAGRAYRNITTPLAEVMAAADAVAEGDLSVRVEESESGPGNQFAKLARSFNRMTAELERSDDLRRSLTADVAHELRTPLHIIQGNLEGVLDGVYEPSDEHVEATLEETRMLARLVDDLHTLSQAEAGQLSLYMEEVDVHELLADVQTSFSGQAESAAVDLTVEGAGDPAQLTVSGDVDRLDQVLSNLSPTPSATPRPAAASCCMPPLWMAPPWKAWCRSVSPTLAKASPPPTCPTSSTASGAATPRARTAPAPASAWPSPNNSSRPKGAR